MGETRIFLAFAHHDSGNGHLPALQEEHDELIKILEDDFKSRKKWGDTKFIPGVSVQKIIDYFNEDLPINIVHFAGHAGPESISMSKEVNGEASEQKLHHINFAEILQPLVKKEGNGLKLVFLNGCATLKQVQDLHKIGVPAVIATRSQVGDCMAKDFAINFYKTLNNADRNLGNAFQNAKAAALPGEDAECVYLQEKLNDLARKGYIKENPEEENWTEDFPWGLYINEDLITKEKILSYSIAPQKIQQQVQRYQKLTQNDHKENVLILNAGEEPNDYFDTLKNSLETGYSTKLDSDFSDKINAYTKEELLAYKPSQQIEILRHTTGIICIITNASKFSTYWRKLIQLEAFKKLNPSLYLSFIVCEGDFGGVEKFCQRDSFINAFKKRNRLSILPEYEKPVRHFDAEWESYLNKEIENSISYTVNQSINSLKERKLIKNMLFELNFKGQKASFKDHGIITSGTYNLISIEGTENCGQEFLMKIFLENMRDAQVHTTMLSPIAIQANLGLTGDIQDNLAKRFYEQIYNSLNLAFHDEQDILNTKQELLTNINNRLQHENLILSIYDFENHLDTFFPVLKSFWNYIATPPTQSSEEDGQESCQNRQATEEGVEAKKRLFIFLIYKGIKLHSEIEGATPNMLQFAPSSSKRANTLPLPVIQPLQREDITEWHQKPLLKSIPHMNESNDIKVLIDPTNIENILEQKYIGRVIEKIAYLTNHPQLSQELLTLRSG